MSIRPLILFYWALLAISSLGGNIQKVPSEKRLSSVVLWTQEGGWEFFPNAPQSVPSFSFQIVEPHRDYAPSIYDFASGLHKYLYAHADPVNGVDPSGLFFTVVEAFAVSVGNSLQKNSDAIRGHFTKSKIKSQIREILEDQAIEGIYVIIVEPQLGVLVPNIGQGHDRLDCGSEVSAVFFPDDPKPH